MMLTNIAFLETHFIFSGRLIRMLGNVFGKCCYLWLCNENIVSSWCFGQYSINSAYVGAHLHR